jgi:hypothetical protein
MPPCGEAETGPAERVYALLLRAYPAAFRAAYGREMRQLFRDQLKHQRSRARTGIGFWTALLWDVARSAPALRLDALRARFRGWLDGREHGGAHLHWKRGTMGSRRPVAILALLGGAFEILNAGADVRAGWGTYRGSGWVVALMLSVAMGALLAAAGVALLRPRSGTTRWVRGGAVASLALAVGIQLVFPYMSIFSRLLAVGIPLALLFVARRPTRGPSVPSVA